MGINGLLSNTKSIGARRHLSHYRGQRVGVDGYSWLHKALHTCGVELALKNDPEKFVRYFETKLQYLLSLELTVLVVFDGDKLPLKLSTETARHQNRQKCYALAMEHYQRGDLECANKLFTQAIDISPAMARFVKERVRRKLRDAVQFLVAPYEADSQLAYLSKAGLIDVVITEDSDLLAFGAARMIYKLDKEFFGVEVELAALERCREFCFRGWNHEKFLFFCILSGCDYLESPRGIGIKKAYSIVARAHGIEQLFGALGERATAEYKLQFRAAFLAFKYQRVYCPKARRIVTLSEFDAESTAAHNATDFDAFRACLEHYGNLDFLGKVYKPQIAAAIANCELDPISKEAFVGEFDFMYSGKRRIVQGKQAPSAAAELERWAKDGERAASDGGKAPRKPTDAAPPAKRDENAVNCRGQSPPRPPIGAESSIEGVVARFRIENGLRKLDAERVLNAFHARFA